MYSVDRESKGATEKEEIMHDPEDVQRTSSKIALAFAILAVVGILVFLAFVPLGIARM